jgi:hypothetical protein
MEVIAKGRWVALKQRPLPPKADSILMVVSVYLILMSGWCAAGSEKASAGAVKRPDLAETPANEGGVVSPDRPMSNYVLGAGRPDCL